MRIFNVNAAKDNVKCAISNVKSAVSVPDGFGRHSRWRRRLAELGCLPTLAGMKLRQGWDTQFCGWERESKNKGGAAGEEFN